jgi:integrase
MNSAFFGHKLTYQGATGSSPFVYSVQVHRDGRTLRRRALRRRFLSACKVLGLARLRALTIHHGRHTFISHALAGAHVGRSPRRRRHANVAITSVYLHVAVDYEGGVGDLFKFE